MYITSNLEEKPSQSMFYYIILFSDQIYSQERSLSNLSIYFRLYSTILGDFILRLFCVCEMEGFISCEEMWALASRWHSSLGE
jgi:hypothetical protein